MTTIASGILITLYALWLLFTSKGDDVIKPAMSFCCILYVFYMFGIWA